MYHIEKYKRETPLILDKMDKEKIKKIGWNEKDR